MLGSVPFPSVYASVTGSHESYVRSVLAPACTPVEQGGLGYRGVVLNFRGCLFNQSYLLEKAKH
jgi:predicted alpha/beta-fold hydrolase